jgi:hypothetical protein
MVFVVGFAVRLADTSDSIVAGNNIRSFVASGRRQRKIDDGTHEAQVVAGE